LLLFHADTTDDGVSRLCASVALPAQISMMSAGVVDVDDVRSLSIATNSTQPVRQRLMIIVRYTVFGKKFTVYDI